MQEILRTSKRKILAAVLCVVTMIGCLPFISAESAYAADGSITLSHDSRVEYGTHFTTKMYADGNKNNIVYCLEPGKWMPDEGSYNYDLLSSSSAIRKALYYLKGGYGYDKYIKTQYLSGWSADQAHAISHLVVSYIYDDYGDDGDAFINTPDSYIAKAKEIANAIKKLPAPPAAFKAFMLKNTGGQDLAGSWYMEPVGWIEIQKSGVNTEITDGNSNYSLKGAKYGVYQGESLIATLTTDEKGYAKSGEIEEGSYTVKEISPSPGYAVDTASHNVNVVTDKISSLKVTEIPQNNPVELILNKIDTETKKNIAQGAGSLAGAEFKFDFYTSNSNEKPERTWTFKTDAEGNIKFDKNHLVSGSEFYYQNDGKTVCLPLGKVVITETKAPTGYLLSSKPFTVNINASGTKETVSTYNAPTSEEQIKRGDLELIKVSDGDLERLAGVPFKITSLTTGENHIIITDKNGYASTAASWNKHTENTNAGKTAEDGIWFGASEPDNSKGALLFDDYQIEELRCDANEGRKLTKVKASIYKDSVTVSLGTLTNDKIEIKTTAKDGKDGDKILDNKGEVEIIDTISYKNLPKGKLIAEGILMDKDTKNPLIIDGKEVVAETAFTVEGEEGTVDVSFVFNIDGFKGSDIVVFEKVYYADSNIVVASHEDINDEGQTVSVKNTKSPAAVNTPKTGDDSSILIWVALLVAAGAGITVLRARKVLRKRHRKEMHDKRIEKEKEVYGEWQ